MGSKRTTAEPAHPQPEIRYNRTLSLEVPEVSQLRLRHLRELVREATERGYTDDTPVTIYAYGLFGSSGGYITVGGRE